MLLIPALSHAEIPKQIPKHLLKYQLKWRNSKKLSLKIRILYVVDKFLTFQIIFFGTLEGFKNMLLFFFKSWNAKITLVHQDCFEHVMIN